VAPASVPGAATALRPLGRGGLEVPGVGIGTNHFGGRMDAAATARVVDAALGLGATFFDTADVYGNGLSKVRFIGNSNFDGAQVDAAAAVSRERRLAAFTSAQNHYSLLTSGIEADLVPACERHGLGILPYFPLESGLLTGKYRRNEAPPEGTRLGTFAKQNPAGAARRVVAAFTAAAASAAVSAPATG
jgi:aryl-alcohol dehydrogenase-like predicted oxidoreductase